LTDHQVEQALIKCASLEKSKNRLQCDMEDLMVDVERANSNALSMEKKQRQFDKLIEEWKLKCEGITIELDVSQREARQYSAEVFKVKAQYDECQESLESIRRENQNLAEEIKDLMTQLSDDGRNVHELEKGKRRLEQEKDELQLALEEAEGALEQQESKITLVHLELSNVRAEIDRRLHEKEEEFDNTRR
jgi:chromosome segregation ATPase